MHLGKLFGAVVLGELRDTWERGTRRSRVGGSYATDCMLVCGPTSCLYAIPTEGQKRESLRTGVTDIRWVDAGNQTLVLGKSRQCF